MTIGLLRGRTGRLLLFNSQFLGLRTGLGTKQAIMTSHWGRWPPLLFAHSWSSNHALSSNLLAAYLSYSKTDAFTSHQSHMPSKFIFNNFLGHQYYLINVTKWYSCGNFNSTYYLILKLKIITFNIKKWTSTLY